MDLRPYQTVAVDHIREHYRRGTRKVLLHLATGGGKTVVFSYILKSMVERGKTGLMVVRGRHLVDQAAERLAREGVPHGILMNGRRAELGHPLYVCSIDTIRARELRPPADLIVIDEAHMATSPSYAKFIADYPTAFVLAVTATPYMFGSIRHVADKIVAPITIKGLITDGYLVPPRYIVPVELDLSGVKVSGATGDYDAAELASFMANAKIIGDIVDNWQKFAQGRPTIIFASNVANSQHIVQMFCANGIQAEHVEANTPDAERRKVLSRLLGGQTKIVSNVGILCTGVDLPHVSCIVMARATKSLNLYIQQAGRGTRPYEGKSDFILLDHANNVKEHGFIDDEHEVFLEGYPKQSKKAEAPIKVCPSCYAAVPISLRFCYCGYEFKIAEKAESTDGELREIQVDDVEVQVRSFIKESKRIQKAKGYARGWVFYQVKNRFGAELAERYMPKQVVPPWVQARNTRGS